MRVHPWIVCIFSVMALFTSQTGFAQNGDMGGLPGPGAAGGPLYPPNQYAPVNAGAPGAGGFVPPPPGGPAGAWDPIAAGQNGGPGYHPDRKPGPNISPFEHRYAEHQNEDGLWFFQSDNSNRRYYANFDIRIGRYRRPDQTKVGVDVAPPGFTPRFNGAPFPDFVPDDGGPNAPFFDFLQVDTGVFFDSFVGNRNQINTIAVGERSGEPDPSVNGFNLEWGFRDPGGNGLELAGWYTPEAHWAYSRGFNPPFEDVLLQTNSANGQPIVITHSLPIAVRDSFVNVPFDRFFGLSFESVSGGGHLDWLMTPLRQSSWYRIAPTVGMQMTYIGETFTFRGVDSGFSAIAPTTTTTVPATGDDFAVGNNGILIPVLPVLAPYEMQIYSEVDSYLFGPQLGLQYEIGGGTPRLVGKSRGGLAANHERLELSGFGVGDPTDLVSYNPNAAFREVQEHTRLSPTTSHEIIAEAKILGLIPIIKKVHFLEQAKFRAGYQINAAFEIQRPHRTIEYNGTPLIPAIRNDRETRWYVESWNFGLHWDY